MELSINTLKLDSTERAGCSEELFNRLEQAAKMDVTQNKVILELSYDMRFVVTYDDALIILSALSRAEKFDRSNWEKPVITPADNKIEMQLLSQDEYYALKMRHLLQMNLSEEVIVDGEEQ